MIKRNDLIKQFELVVQQEIKNHNSEIASHNSAIDHLRRMVCENALSLSKSIDGAVNRIDSIQRDIKRSECMCDELSSKIDSSINDMSKLIEQTISIVNALSEDISMQQVDLNDLIKDCNNHNVECRENFSAIDVELVDIRRYIDLCCKKIYESITRKFEELDARPCKVEAAKAEIFSRIEMKETHTRGVLEEIRALRREFLYEKAKIENIYTLIERLQKKGNS